MKALILLGLITCGCVTMSPDNYYRELYYNFPKNKIVTTNIGAEMMIWGEKLLQEDPRSAYSGNVSFTNSSKSLTYSGKQGNTLRLYYREYSDDYARPAFMQELSYDITNDSTINFRDNRIGIVEANNRYISFIVFDSKMFSFKSGIRIPVHSAAIDTSEDIFRPGSGHNKIK